MGKGNVMIKQWLSDKKRFSSFVNGALFQGKQVFSEDKLEVKDGQLSAVLKDTEGKDITVERFRDILMAVQDGTNIVLIACENQEEIHYAMPIRTMLYDSLNYVEQINVLKKQHKVEKDWKDSAEFLSGLKAEDLLIPVITLVFYYGETPWDGHKDLHGLLGIDREEYELIKKYIPNYTMNLIDPREIEDLTCFETDLQMVFGMLQYRKNKTKLIDYVREHEEFFTNVDVETGNAVKILLGTETLLQNTKRNEDGGINMCQALDEYYQDGVNEGMEKGRQSMLLEIINGKIAKGKSIVEIADVLDKSVEEIQKLLSSAKSA